MNAEDRIICDHTEGSQTSLDLTHWIILRQCEIGQKKERESLIQIRAAIITYLKATDVIQ